jgi:membrane protease YdiL (CAAX protease family)
MADSDTADEPIEFLDCIGYPAAGGLLAMFAAALVAGFVIAAIASAGTPHMTPAQLGEHSKTIVAGFFPQKLLELILYGAVLLFLYRSRTLGPRMSTTMLLEPVPRLVLAKSFRDGVVLSFVIIAGITALALAQQRPVELSHAETRMFPSHSEQAGFATAMRWLLTLFVFCFTAPFVEEFYFRAAIFGWLRQRLAPAAALWLSGGVFALCHFKWLVHPNLQGVLATLGICFMGVRAAQLYRRYGTLVPSIVFHGGYNLLIVLVMMIGRR